MNYDVIVASLLAVVVRSSLSSQLSNTTNPTTTAYLIPPLLTIPQTPPPPSPLATPHLLILTPTSELSHQVSTISKSLSGRGAGFWRTTVVHGSGKDIGEKIEKGESVRDQMRELGKKGTDVLIGTPGRGESTTYIVYVILSINIYSLLLTSSYATL